jgi:uncharacterized membrane protein
MEHFQIYQWLSLFFLFSFIGWIHESTVESLYARKFINRGFLRGPYIPIYGFGGILMTVCCLPVQFNAFAVFAVGAFVCTVLEFTTGALMERLFGKQFWDYSMLKFTYKNRINLFATICWGLLALLLVYGILKLAVPLLQFVEWHVLIGINLVISVVMGIDAVKQLSRYERFERVAKNFRPLRSLRPPHPKKFNRQYFTNMIYSHLHFFGGSDQHDDDDDGDDE